MFGKFFSKYSESREVFSWDRIDEFLSLYYADTLRHSWCSCQRKRQKIKYLNLALSFDIETTNTEIDGVEIGYCYIWQFSFNGYVFIGRKLSEFEAFIKRIAKYLSLSETRKIVIYVHNLEYEFQFIKDYFNFDDVFALSAYKPLKAICSELGVEFRCSYKLTNQSLENVSKETSTKKLTGDLDYNKIRNSLTQLSEKELAYCIHDVEVVVEYIKKMIATYGNVIKIPLTSTGKVRVSVKNNLKKSKNYMNKIRYTTLSGVEEFELLKKAFQGGYTHASANKVGKNQYNVTSMDFTSSYPAVMCYSNRFPVGSGVKVKNMTPEKFDYLITNQCLIFEVTFYDLNPRTLVDSYISQSKCKILENPILNNGRVVAAKKLQTVLTELDFEVVKQVYKWEKMSVGLAYTYRRGYLPKEYIENILTYFKKKTELKGVKGSEDLYSLYKTYINSLYGMMVTAIDNPEVVYDSGAWDDIPPDLEEIVRKYNNSQSRFLIYAQGVYVTAIARFNLWRGILNLGYDYCYSDTDSVKFLNAAAHKDFFENDNTRINTELHRMAEHYGIDTELLHPKNKEGTAYTLGLWDFDGHYKVFKTLGAKRYIYLTDNNELHITVAGLGKKQGCRYIVENFGRFGAFKQFTNNMNIPSEGTGKLTHKYYDLKKPEHFKLTDYQGITEKIEVRSFVYLCPCEFSMSLADEYLRFLKGIRDDYKHI